MNIALKFFLNLISLMFSTATHLSVKSHVIADAIYQSWDTYYLGRFVVTVSSIIELMLVGCGMTIMAILVPDKEFEEGTGFRARIKGFTLEVFSFRDLRLSIIGLCTIILGCGMIVALAYNIFRLIKFLIKIM
jgi:hypothetical protein